MSPPTLLLLNAGLGGSSGNSAAMLTELARHLKRKAKIVPCVLAESTPAAALELLAQADGLVIATGTYWDSWSSSLQAFLEAATPTEGTRLWLGKPVAVIVTMHAVGGKAVLSRLQGVLNTFGCLIPPQSGLVYAQVNQSALATDAPDTDDLWRPEDLRIIAHNLLTSLASQPKYKNWPVDRKNFHAKWVKLD